MESRVQVQLLKAFGDAPKHFTVTQERVYFCKKYINCKKTGS